MFCADIATAAMVHPDNTQITKSYTEPLTNNMSVELRTTAHAGWVPSYLQFMGDTSTLRYLYLKHDNFFSRDIDSCFFSIDIDSVGSEELDGALSNPGLLRMAERSTMNGSLRRIFAISRAAIEGTLKDEDVPELNGLFMRVTERADVDTYSFRSFDFNDASNVVIYKHEYNSGLYVPRLNGSPLTIHLTPPRSDVRTTFQKLPDNSYETFEEPTDENKHAAKYLDEEDIFRAENGRIIGVRIPPEKAEAIAEAERALGFRCLNDIYLSRIEDAMDKVDVIVRGEQ